MTKNKTQLERQLNQEQQKVDEELVARAKEIDIILNREPRVAIKPYMIYTEGGAFPSARLVRIPNEKTNEPETNSEAGSPSSEGQE